MRQTDAEVVILAWDMDGSMGECAVCRAFEDVDSQIGAALRQYVKSSTQLVSGSVGEVIIRPATNRKDRGLEQRNTLVGRARPYKKYSTPTVLAKVLQGVRTVLESAENTEVALEKDDKSLVQTLYEQYSGKPSIWSNSYKSLLMRIGYDAHCLGLEDRKYEVFFDLTHPGEESVAGSMKLDIILGLAWQYQGEKEVELNIFDDRFYDPEPGDEEPMTAVCMFLREYPQVLPSNVTVKMHKLDYFELQRFVEVGAAKRGVVTGQDSVDREESVEKIRNLGEEVFGDATEQERTKLLEAMMGPQYEIRGTSGLSALYNTPGLAFWEQVMHPAAQAFCLYYNWHKSASADTIWDFARKQQIEDLLQTNHCKITEASAEKEGATNRP